jgi:exopolysaccharide biosynthesis polyprenyl glycosylphosphotransferase
MTPRVSSEAAREETVDLRPQTRLARAADRLGVFEIPAHRGGAAARVETFQRDARFRRLLALADLLATAVGLLIVVELSGADQLRPAALMALPAVVVMNKLLGLYDRDELLLHKATLDEAPTIFQAATLYSILVWFLEALIINGALSKTQFLLLWSSTFGLCLAGRAVARWIANHTALAERCLFLGPPEALELIQAKLALRGGQRGVDIVSRQDLEDEHGRVLVSGRLAAVVDEHDAHRLVLAPTAVDSDAVLELIREAKATGVKISLMPRFSEVLGSSVVFDDLHGITLLAVRRVALSRSSRAIKRSFDLAIAGTCLALMAPLFALISLAIKLTTPGPVFYRQTRIGRGGEAFQIFKFRTMIQEADQLRAELEHLNETEGFFKIAGDPRITTVGRLLRRTYLDELPQLLNVVRGEMSIVGPRPLVMEDDERIAGWHRQRLDISPGMTGHWQVLGSSRIPLQEMVAIDYLYVVNWSLWGDFKYLLRTVPYVLGARGL